MRQRFFMASSDDGLKTPASRWIGPVLWCLGLLLVVCLWRSPTIAKGREHIAVDPYKVEAAFLRNFAHYVNWPHGTFSRSDTPWHIGILGPDPFKDFLENTFRGRTEQGRTFKIYRANSLDELPECQIVFIAYRDAAKRSAALARLKNKPVLTVGEASSFLNEGGIIRFHVRDRVGISVNLDQARYALLSIQTKMLEVSEQVIENGKVRKMR